MGLFVAELVVWASAWWCGRQLLGLKGHVRHLVRPFVAALLALWLVVSLPLPSPLWRVAVGVVTLVVLAYASDGAVRAVARRASVRVSYRRER